MVKPDPHAVGRLWLEEGAADVGLVATVAPIAPVDKEYSYAVPPELAARLSVGQRVAVRLGRRGRPIEAFCVEFAEREWEHTLRPIDALVDDESYLPQPLLELGRWISHYYCCPLGPTLAAMVPRAVRQKRGFATTRYARLARTIEEIMSASGRVSAKARGLLDALAASPARLEVSALLERAGASQATLRGAVEKGWITLESERQVQAAPRLDVARADPSFALTAEQAEAVRGIGEKIDAGGFGVTLLFGVSGSGKTEVYVRAIRRALDRGLGAILLVPEIALTTQLVNRLASRFEDVAVVHSGLSDKARSLYWRAIARGELRVVVGTRSAVFAPCPRLGLLVIDEEQEAGYKNLQAPRFHVRDVAIKRAQFAGIPIILGSATPSLESWQNCQRMPHYERMDLPRRVGDRPLPRVTVVDVAAAAPDAARSPSLSPLMRSKLGGVLDRGEQAVVLINRRGSAWGIHCPVCGWRLGCPRCNVPLVLHAARGQALCHYCRARVVPPAVCPQMGCRAPLVRTGVGTQRVEEELGALFPKARVARADSDTMKRAADYQALVDRLAAREIDLLVGTQMIGKGLDFPFVSFVGVIGADLGGAGQDFRAAERLFQLVTQVAGRAGRGQTAGEVIVQTMTPDAAALRAACAQDFPGFAKVELALRERVRFPPFARLTRMVFADSNDGRAKRAAADLAAAARACIEKLSLESIDLLGPQPCALARLRDRYRYDVLLRATRAADMQRVLEELRGQRTLKPNLASFVVDVDPVELS